jgi:hypothetical protein
MILKDLLKVILERGLPVLAIPLGVGLMGSIYIQEWMDEDKRRGKIFYAGTITGTIQEEIYSNTKNKSESKYTLKILTDDKRTIGVSVLDAPDTKKESLDILIDKDSRVRFPVGNVQRGDKSYNYSYVSDETYFGPNTKFGNKRTDRIEILD